MKDLDELTLSQLKQLHVRISKEIDKRASNTKADLLKRMRKLAEQEGVTLEDLLGEGVEHFCYPFGDYTERSRDMVQEAGYRTATTCIRGVGNLSDNPLELTRKAISYGDNLVGFAWKLHMKHERKGQGPQPDKA